VDKPNVYDISDINAFTRMQRLYVRLCNRYFSEPFACNSETNIIYTGFSQKENYVIIYQTYTFSKLKRELSSVERKWQCSVITCEAFLKTIGEKKT